MSWCIILLLYQTLKIVPETFPPFPIPASVYKRNPCPVSKIIDYIITFLKKKKICCIHVFTRVTMSIYNSGLKSTKEFWTIDRSFIYFIVFLHFSGRNVISFNNSKISKRHIKCRVHGFCLCYYRLCPNQSATHAV